MRSKLALGIASLGIAWSGGATGVGSQLAAAVSAWLEGLDADQRDSVHYADDDAERFDLRLAPMGLEGLSGEEMSESQWRQWLDALGLALSAEGRRKVETIMSLEREVQQLDQRSFFWRWFGRLYRGERRYFASVYGDPGGDAPWGLRFDGHHLSLNWTEAGGELSVTPLFLGSQPRQVPEGWERAGLRALAAEEDAGLALWTHLAPKQRAKAELELAHPTGLGGRVRPLFLGEGERVRPGEPRGIARREMNAAAQAALDALIETWLANFAPAVASRQRARIDAAGREGIHFALAGNLAPGEPGYYRVQGPTFLIEWDDTAPEADHVHTLWRDFEGDYGRDGLGEHYARAHGPGGHYARAHGAEW